MGNSNMKPNDNLHEAMEQIMEFEDDIYKILTLSDDLTDDFFNKTDVSTKSLKTTSDSSGQLSNPALVLYTYDKYSAYSSIMHDYIFNLKSKLEALENKIDALISA